MHDDRINLQYDLDRFVEGFNHRFEEWREALNSSKLRISRFQTEYKQYDFDEW